LPEGHKERAMPILSLLKWHLCRLATDKGTRLEGASTLGTRLGSGSTFGRQKCLPHCKLQQV
jgi:hypothetical protein